MGHKDKSARLVVTSTNKIWIKFVCKCIPFKCNHPPDGCLVH